MFINCFVERYYKQKCLYENRKFIGKEIQSRNTLMNFDQVANHFDTLGC